MAEADVEPRGNVVGETVSQFVINAFPNATIPHHPGNDHRDFSINLLGHFPWKGYFAPTGDKKTYQAPIWPADLFGVTSALLERSGAYLKLANQIAPVSKDSRVGFEWLGEFKPEAASETDSPTDPFGVHGKNRLVLRLVGALLRHGALIISGHLNVNGSIATQEDIQNINQTCAFDAIAALKARNNLDYSDQCITDAVHELQNMIRDELNICSNDVDMQMFSEKYSVSTMSSLSIKCLQYYSNQLRTRIALTDESSCGLRMDDFDKRGRKEIGGHILIIWASHYIQYHWDVLLNCERPILLPLSAEEGGKEDWQWWRAAMRLLIIADEAGKGTGFTGDSENEPSRSKVEYSAGKPTSKSDGTIDENGNSIQENDVKQLKNPLPIGLMCKTIWNEYLLHEMRRIKSKSMSTTLTRSLNPALGAVLPKTRTPSNGCTIRSLSHNLALLPPKGRVRARWARQSKDSQATSFNILLVPFPYQIKSSYVSPCNGNKMNGWGFFSVTPGWLYEQEADFEKSNPGHGKDICRGEFWKFLKSLLDKVEGGVDAVVFPEGSLDGETFDYIQKEIVNNYPGITMLVCGLTSMPPSYKKSRRDDKAVIEPPKLDDTAKARPQNLVATYLRHKDSRSWETIYLRSKHHRWKIDARQLESYALSHRLQPDMEWWEDIDIPPREMLFAEFSCGSVVTTLICEDLARIEPCQVALRSVGPNLVLVLLMDTAQKLQRWPYQYAGILADDPGCSVLTLTSFGLVRRSNHSEGYDSREIGVWREPHTGRAREIKLPKNHDAVLLSLSRHFCKEQTLDGRNDNGDSAIVWRYAGLAPLRSNCRPPGGDADAHE